MVGPCKVRCVHYRDKIGGKTIALWNDPAGFSLDHSHREKQLTAILAGKFRLRVGDNPVEQLGPGSTASIAPDVPHSIEAKAAGIVLDIFTPRRVQIPGRDV
jgi:quercetin dioxygenase-like cupin family protein